MIVRTMCADFSSVQNGLAGAPLNCGHFPKELIDALKGMELSRSIPCLLFFQCRNLILTYGEKIQNHTLGDLIMAHLITSAPIVMLFFGFKRE